MRRAQRAQVGALPGPRRYEIAWDADPSRRAALDAMLAILDAGLRDPDERTELDVERTVEETARAGLVPTLVHRARGGRRRALVLEETGPMSRPFRAKTDAFVARLALRGVEVERLWFDRDPTRVSRRPGGRVEALASHAPRLRGLPLVILGAGEGIAAAAHDPQEQLRAALRPWPVRVLLSPLRDPDLWPAGLTAARAPIGAWPMSPRGLLGAARQMIELRRYRRATAHLPSLPQPRITIADVHRLRAMLALAPSPSFELAEALRGRFLPHAPEEIVLAAEPLVQGGAGAPDREALDAAIRFFRAEDPARRREAEVRRFLLDLLERSRPPDERSAAFLRFRSDVALQRLHLADDDAERARRRGELVEIGVAALGPELADEIEDALALERRLGGAAAVRRAEPLQALATALGSPRAARATLGGRRLGRLALSWKAAAGVLGAAAGVAAVLAALGVFSARPLVPDGDRHIVWSRDDLRDALYAADGFIDVYVLSEKVYVLAALRSDPAAGDASPHELMVFQIDTGWPVFPIARAQALGVGVTPSSESDVLFDRLPTGELLLLTRDPANPEQFVAEAIEQGSLTLAARQDYFGSFPLLDERAADIARHSGGILPGAADEVVQRLVALVYGEPLPTAAPSCLPPRLRCEDACVDPRTDPSHCGACGVACTGGRVCSEGACACPEGREACDGRCVDTRTDVQHCGGCGRACEGAPCVDGECTAEPRCPEGQTSCAGRCVDTAADPAHCGACDTPCVAGAHASASCKRGVCSRPCATGWGDCNGKPDDGCEQSLGEDSHCGRCGNLCAAGALCQKGTCVPKTSKPADGVTTRATCVSRCEAARKACAAACQRPGQAGQADPPPEGDLRRHGRGLPRRPPPWRAGAVLAGIGDPTCSERCVEKYWSCVSACPPAGSDKD